MAHAEILELLRRDLDDGEYGAIRELWKQHSLAEDARDVAGLLATLTDDCVYEIVGDVVDMRRDGRGVEAGAYAALMILGLAASGAAVIFGVLVMTTK